MQTELPGGSDWGEEVTVLRIPEAHHTLMSSEEVADALNMSERTLLQLASVGKGPPYYGWAHEPFFRSVEVEQWIRNELRSLPGIDVLY